MAFNLFGKKKKKEEKPEVKEEAKTVAPKKEAKKVKVRADTGNATTYSVIKHQHITEKSSYLAAFNKYVFKVYSTANKKNVKDAVEKLYGVTVENVHMVNIPAKFITVGRFDGRKSGYKKAIVTLKQGDKIEVAPH